ncbi:MAG: PEP-CTERM sorting domain-containing protein [Burkholderiales bacterium]|uniref:PEP-CTERM sorting domain-containing protein n=1 Tax=Inhella sp. TaxID=1921806 RepID=UPI001ACBDC72|nr:PEP-CTERM sorting domain-containing protein [Burkholderiales bacterium]
MKWWRMGLASLALVLSGLTQAAGLTGDQVKISLLSPNGIAGDSNPVSLVDQVLVGAGAEIAAGDATNIGSFMLPGESVDLGEYTIQVRLGSGAVNGQGQQNPGYAAGAEYLFEQLDIFGETIVGASISSHSGFSNFSDGWLSFLGPHSLSLDIGSMLFTGGLADFETFGLITITLQTRPDDGGGGGGNVPEPGALLLAGVALLAWRAGARRRRPC